MNIMPRVGMLIARFHPFEGGAEIQCRRLALGLKQQECETFVLTRKLSGTPSFQLLDGLHIHRIAPLLQNRLGSLWYLFSGFFWLLRNRERCNLLHAHLASSPAILAALASSAFGIPAILKIAGSRATGDIGTSSRTWFGRLKLAYLKRSIDLFVCPSRETKEELIRSGFPAEKITIIPNGVLTDLFRPSTAEEKLRIRLSLGLPGKTTIVLYAGRLEPGKGLETLIGAWRALSRSPESQLIILGNGSLEIPMKKAAAGSETILFAGWRENVVDYVRAADIFVLPSFGEGLPNSLLEAMSCGLACLATRIGGITELIAPGRNGILAAPGNGNELARELEELIGDASLRARLGAAARESVEKNYAMRAVVRRYADLYRGLLAGGTVS